MTSPSTSPLISTAARTAFRRTVLAYFRAHGRDLPWRHTRDPYCVLVSEIMLQQTQVDRVVVKYQEFTARFPDFPSLASASLRDVLSAWQGLGYNRRGLSLKRAAEMIVKEHHGTLPRSPEELIALPGIGPATARSICVYAFDRPEVFVETNIRAVFIHHFFPGRDAVGDEELLPLVEATLDRRNPWRWYSALMDYGVMLKKQHANPARRSRHHLRQSRFEGSDRQVRGRILRALVESLALPLSGIFAAAATDQARTKKILDDLVAEGLARKAGAGRFSVA